MAYIKETGSILVWMGYEIDIDFDTTLFTDGAVLLNWYHTDPKPTELDILNNELPWAQDASINLIKIDSHNKRNEFMTLSAGKDLEYREKKMEAEDYLNNSVIGPYMQARIDKTLETAADIANEWSSKDIEWTTLSLEIASNEDHGRVLILAETDPDQCFVIAQNTIDNILGITGKTKKK